MAGRRPRYGSATFESKALAGATATMLFTVTPSHAKLRMNTQLAAHSGQLTVAFTFPGPDLQDPS
jgi:hypothetical protein